jgi:hypothetical protein
MADTGALDAGGEVVAELVLEVAAELVAEEHGHVLGTDDMHGSAHDGLVEGLEDRLLAKDHVGGIFHLHEAPVVTAAEVLHHRAEARGPTIQMLVQGVGVEGVGELLGPQGIGEAEEGIVGHREVDPGSAQLLGEPGVAVEVDLQTKWCPGGHSHVAQAEVCVDEVEVVVQALAARGLEQRLALGFVEPGPVGGAGLHGGEDMHQARVRAPRGEDRLDAIFLTKCLVTADELDGEAGLPGQALGVGPQRLAQGLRPLGVVKHADAQVAEQPRHGTGVGDRWQGAVDHHPVETRQHPGNVALMTFNEGVHRRTSSAWGLTTTIDPGTCLVPAMPG